jgi:hypothetical protein
MGSLKGREIISSVKQCANLKNVLKYKLLAQSKVVQQNTERIH